MDRRTQPFSEIATKPAFRNIDGVSVRFVESERRGADALLLSVTSSAQEIRTRVGMRITAAAPNALHEPSVFGSHAMAMARPTARASPTCVKATASSSRSASGQRGRAAENVRRTSK